MQRQEKAIFLMTPKTMSLIEDQFLHTQFFALVDKAGRVRKIYDGLKKEEIEAVE